MKRVKVFVTLKEAVLDPQGQAVQQSLHNLNYSEVKDVRVGKYFELTVDETENIESSIDAMCDKVLANTVIEDYRYEVEEVVSQ